METKGLLLLERWGMGEKARDSVIGEQNRYRKKRKKQLERDIEKEEIELKPKSRRREERRPMEDK